MYYVYGESSKENFIVGVTAILSPYQAL